MSARGPPPAAPSSQDQSCPLSSPPLTRAQRSTWNMEPSLPPQNMWCSARSMVTAMMPTSNRTDSSNSPEESSHSWGAVGVGGVGTGLWEGQGLVVLVTRVLNLDTSVQGSCSGELSGSRRWGLPWHGACSAGESLPYQEGLRAVTPSTCTAWPRAVARHLAKWEFPGDRLGLSLPLDALGPERQGITSCLEADSWGGGRFQPPGTPLCGAQLPGGAGLPSLSGPARRWPPGPGGPQSRSAGL